MRKPEPYDPNRPPMIPAPKGDGCQWCGKQTASPRATSCIQCSVREQGHRQRMNALAEQKAKLEIELMKAELAQRTGDAADA